MRAENASDRESAFGKPKSCYLCNGYINLLMRVYLDNAATTPLDPEVFEAMKPFMLEDFGNPSSINAHGRKVRAAIESAHS